MSAGLRGQLETFKCALQGIASALNSEAHLRFEMVVAVVALLLCFVLQVGFWAWIVVLGFIGLVLCLELVNTAIEAAVDLASPVQHPLAKKAKDAAAGAVLIASTLALVAGLAIYINALVRLVAH